MFHVYVEALEHSRSQLTSALVIAEVHISHVLLYVWWKFVTCGDGMCVIENFLNFGIGLLMRDRVIDVTYGCRGTWVENHDNCYRYVKTLATWEEAFTECHTTTRASLASFSSASQLTEADLSGHWIGLNSRASPERPRMYENTDGSPVLYTPWSGIHYANQTTTADVNCVIAQGNTIRLRIQYLPQYFSSGIWSFWLIHRLVDWLIDQIQTQLIDWLITSKFNQLIDWLIKSRFYLNSYDAWGYRIECETLEKRAQIWDLRFSCCIPWTCEKSSFSPSQSSFLTLLWADFFYCVQGPKRQGGVNNFRVTLVSMWILFFNNSDIFQSHCLYGKTALCLHDSTTTSGAKPKRLHQTISRPGLPRVGPRARRKMLLHGKRPQHAIRNATLRNVRRSPWTVSEALQRGLGRNRRWRGAGFTQCPFCKLGCGFVDWAEAKRGRWVECIQPVDWRDGSYGPAQLGSWGAASFNGWWE